MPGGRSGSRTSAATDGTHPARTRRASDVPPAAATAIQASQPRRRAAGQNKYRRASVATEPIISVDNAHSAMPRGCKSAAASPASLAPRPLRSAEPERVP